MHELENRTNPPPRYKRYDVKLNENFESISGCGGALGSTPNIGPISLIVSKICPNGKQ